VVSLVTVLLNMGEIACDQGDTRRATELLHESLWLAWQARRLRTIAYVLEGLAEVAWLERRADAAARLYGAAAALRERAHALILPYDSAGYDRTVAEVRTALGEEAFTAAWEAGRSTPLEHLIADLEQEHHRCDDRTTPDVAHTA
jgi:hypothetical protein